MPKTSKMSNLCADHSTGANYVMSELVAANIGIVHLANTYEQNDRPCKKKFFKKCRRKNVHCCIKPASGLMEDI